MSYQTVTQALEGLFHKKLNKLPQRKREVAEYHIPEWNTMPESQRQQRAHEIDRQADLKQRIKVNRINRIPPPQPGSAESQEFEQGWAEFSEQISPPGKAPSPQLRSHSQDSTPASSVLVEIQSAARSVEPANTVMHSTKASRRDSIDPVIEQAQRKCKNKKDTAEVWAQMQVLAEAKTTHFIGASEEGLQYLKKGEVAYFTRDALNKRLHPDKRGKPGKRR